MSVRFRSRLRCWYVSRFGARHTGSARAGAYCHVSANGLRLRGVKSGSRSGQLPAQLLSIEPVDHRHRATALRTPPQCRPRLADSLRGMWPRICWQQGEWEEWGREISCAVRASRRSPSSI